MHAILFITFKIICVATMIIMGKFIKRFHWELIKSTTKQITTICFVVDIVSTKWNIYMCMFYERYYII